LKQITLQKKVCAVHKHWSSSWPCIRVVSACNLHISHEVALSFSPASTPCTAALAKTCVHHHPLPIAMQTLTPSASGLRMATGLERSRPPLAYLLANYTAKTAQQSRCNIK
jgi:hypothetical protein